MNSKKWILMILLILLIIPMMFAQELSKEEIQEMVKSEIDSEKYYKGSQVQELIIQVMEMMMEENNKAMENTVNDAVSEGVIPLIVENESKDLMMQQYKKNNTSLSFQRWIFLIVGMLSGYIINDITGG